MRNAIKILALLAALIAVTAFAPASQAASEAKADAHGAKTHAEADKDPIGFTGYKRWDLAIYTVIVFVLLYAILSKFAYPNIVKGLKAREDQIASAKEDAIKAKEEAEAQRKLLAAEMATAQDKIRALLEEARRDADALRVKEREAGQKEAAAERERAKREIEAAKDAALQEIYQKSVDLATMISTKAIRRGMNADDHRRLVDESLVDLKNGRI